MASTTAAAAAAAPKQSIPPTAAATTAQNASAAVPVDVGELEGVAEESTTGRVDAAAAAAAAKAAQAVVSRALTNDANPVRLASMIDLRDVLRLSLLCKEMGASYGRRARKTCLTKGAGVPQDRRIEFWMCMLNVEKASMLL